MPLCVDTSALAGLVFLDEDSSYAAAVFNAVWKHSATVPALFWFELRNAFLIGERRKRIRSDRTNEFLADVGRLPLIVDFQPVEADVMRLARHYQLTVYDAAYLELAARRSMPLATLDRALISAAGHAGVAIWQPA